MARWGCAMFVLLVIAGAIYLAGSVLGTYTGVGW